MLYWSSKGIDTLSAHRWRSHTDDRQAHGKDDQVMILLLFQQRGVSFGNQAFSLSAVTPGGS